MLNELFKLLKNDPSIKAGADALTLRTSTGGPVILSKLEYDVHTIRSKINTIFKAKPGNPGLNITIETLPAGDPGLDEDEADFSALGLDGYEFLGSPN